jgi:hypothetical protein
VTALPTIDAIEDVEEDAVEEEESEDESIPGGTKGSMRPTNGTNEDSLRTNGTRMDQPSPTLSTPINHAQSQASRMTMKRYPALKRWPGRTSQTRWKTSANDLHQLLSNGQTKLAVIVTWETA